MLVTVMTPVAFWVGASAVDRVVLIGSCWLVVIVELLNSAIEAIVDRVGTEHHALSGRAKDLGSAGVLISLVLMVTVWGLLVWERFASG